MEEARDGAGEVRESVHGRGRGRVSGMERSRGGRGERVCARKMASKIVGNRRWKGMRREVGESVHAKGRGRVSGMRMGRG